MSRRDPLTCFPARTRSLSTTSLKECTMAPADPECKYEHSDRVRILRTLTGLRACGTDSACACGR